MRYAIIGTGSMGKKYAAMLNGGDVKDAVLTAVVCRSESNKEWARANLSQSVRVHDSADELYDNPDEYDTVLIVTPHKSHPELAIKAFAIGKNVFCDKPAGVSVKQAASMNAAARSAGKLYGMMFHQRLYEKYIAIKEILDAGKLGEVKRVMLVNSRFYRTRFYHDSSEWRSSWTGEGGGALINQGQHIIDIWIWLFGMPESIYANIPFGKYNDFDVDDEATLLMTYKNKMSAVFMLTTGEAVWEERLEIIGTKGSILLEDDDMTMSLYEDVVEYGQKAIVNSREQLNVTLDARKFPHSKEPYVNMLDNFTHSMSENDLIAPGSAGYNALQITNAAYLSAWKEEKVNLPIEEDEYEMELNKHMV